MFSICICALNYSGRNFGYFAWGFGMVQILTPLVSYQYIFFWSREEQENILYSSENKLWVLMQELEKAIDAKW